MPLKNILFITADQFRGDCLSALGHPDVQTPHLDELIADAQVFKQHYAVCAPCGPSRASLLTGMYLQNHRSVRNGTPLDDRHSNLARELRKSGYKPMLFGYTDTTLDPRAHSDQTLREFGYESIMPGFEDGLFLPGEQPDKWLAWLRQHGHDFATVDEAHANIHAGTDKAPAVAFAAEHSQAAYLTQSVIDYIKQFQAPATAPATTTTTTLDGQAAATQQTATTNKNGWCVHLSYLRPHPPFTAPAPYDTLYDPAKLAALDSYSIKPDEHPWLKAARGPLGDWPEPWMAELAGSAGFERTTQQIRASYYGLISKIDHYIGELIQHLKASGEYDNTLIIFTSDHGEMLGDHGLFGKRGYFSESYHVPLIIRDPYQTAKPGSHALFTEAVDILPTMLDWLGQGIPRQCDGRSLLPFWHNPAPANWRQAAHWEYDFRDASSPALEQNLGISMDQCQLNVIRDDEYLYAHFTALPAVFFDLKRDPTASQNVIKQPQYASQVLAYAQKLLSWRMANDERELTGYVVSSDAVYCRD